MPTSYDEEERIYHKGFREGYAAALEQSERFGTARVRKEGALSRPSPKPKRKASPANKKYGAAFRKVSPRFKTKSGKWKKNGFKNAVKAAHKLARRK